jgi:DNA-binding NtrC family response regulator
MPRILVVDDEEGIRKLLSIALTRAGHEVRAAADAREAMALCSTESFDVLLSDVRMPQLNGHELVRWVTTWRPAIRCVLMSAFDDTDCQDCPFSSRCRLLPKPFNPKDAVSVVERTLQSPPPASRCGGDCAMRQRPCPKGD